MPTPDEQRQNKAIRRELDAFVDTSVVEIAESVKTGLQRAAPRDTGLLSASFQTSRTPEGALTRRGGSAPSTPPLKPGPIPRPAYTSSTLSYANPVQSEQGFVDAGLQEAVARAQVSTAIKQAVSKVSRSTIIPRFKG